MEQKLHTPEGVRDIYNKECEIKKRSLSMRIVKAIENMTASNQKLMYMCNTRPVLKTGALFSDVTEEYRIPYKFFDREGNILALRPDITPSIARAVATLFETEDFPIRLCG